MKIDNLKSLYLSRLSLANYQQLAKTLVRFSDSLLTNKLLEMVCMDTDGDRANAVLTMIFEEIGVNAEIDWQFLGSVRVSECNFFLIRERVFGWMEGLTGYCRDCERFKVYGRENERKSEDEINRAIEQKKETDHDYQVGMPGQVKNETQIKGATQVNKATNRSQPVKPVINISAEILYYNRMSHISKCPHHLISPSQFTPVHTQFISTHPTNYLLHQYLINTYTLTIKPSTIDLKDLRQFYLLAVVIQASHPKHIMDVLLACEWCTQRDILILLCVSGCAWRGAQRTIVNELCLSACSGLKAPDECVYGDVRVQRVVNRRITREQMCYYGLMDTNLIFCLSDCSCAHHCIENGVVDGRTCFGCINGGEGAESDGISGSMSGKGCLRNEVLDDSREEHRKHTGIGNDLDKHSNHYEEQHGTEENDRHSDRYVNQCSDQNRNQHKERHSNRAPSSTREQKRTSTAYRCKWCNRQIPQFNFVRMNCKDCDLTYTRMHDRGIKFCQIKDFTVIQIMETSEIDIVGSIKRYLRWCVAGRTIGTIIESCDGVKSGIAGKTGMTDSTTRKGGISGAMHAHDSLSFISTAIKAVIHYGKLTRKSLTYILLFVLESARLVFTDDEMHRIKVCTFYRDSVKSVVEHLKGDRMKVLLLCYLMGESIRECLVCVGHAIYECGEWEEREYEELCCSTLGRAKCGTRYDEKFDAVVKRGKKCYTSAERVPALKQLINSLFTINEQHLMLQKVHSTVLAEQSKSIHFDLESLVIHAMRTGEKCMNDENVVQVIRGNITPVLYTLKRYGGSLHDLMSVLSVFECLESVYYEVYVFVEWFMMREHERMREIVRLGHRGVINAGMRGTGAVIKGTDGVMRGAGAVIKGTDSGMGNSRMKSEEMCKTDDSNEMNKLNSKTCSNKAMNSTYIDALLLSFYGIHAHDLSRFIHSYTARLNAKEHAQLAVFLSNEEMEQNGWCVLERLLCVKGEYTEMIAAYRVSREYGWYDDGCVGLLYKYGYYEVIGRVGYSGVFRCGDGEDDLVDCRDVMGGMGVLDFDVMRGMRNTQCCALFNPPISGAHPNTPYRTVNTAICRSTPGYFPDYFNFQNKPQFIKLLLENLLIQIVEPIEIYFYAIQTLLKHINLSLLHVTKRSVFKTYTATKYELKGDGHNDALSTLALQKNDEVLRVGALFTDSTIRRYFSLYCMKFYGKVVFDVSDDDLVMAGYFYGGSVRWRWALSAAVRRKAWCAVEKIVERVFESYGLCVGRNGFGGDGVLGEDCLGRGDGLGNENENTITSADDPSTGTNEYTANDLLDLLQHAYYGSKDFLSLSALSRVKFDETTLLLAFKTRGYGDEDESDTFIDIEEVNEGMERWNDDYVGSDECCAQYFDHRTAFDGRTDQKNFTGDDPVASVDGNKSHTTRTHPIDLNGLMSAYQTDGITNDNLTRIHFIHDLYCARMGNYGTITQKRRAMLDMHKMLRLHCAMVRSGAHVDVVFEDELLIDRIEWCFRKGLAGKSEKMLVEMMVRGDWRALYYYGWRSGEMFYFDRAVDKLAMYGGENKVGGEGETNEKMMRNSGSGSNDSTENGGTIPADSTRGAQNGLIDDSAEDQSTHKIQNDRSARRSTSKDVHDKSTRFGSLKNTAYYRSSCSHFYRQSVIARTLKRNTLEAFEDAIERLGRNEKVLFYKAKLMEGIDRQTSYALYLESMRYGERYFEEAFPRALHLFTEHGCGEKMCDGVDGTKSTRENGVGENMCGRESVSKDGKTRTVKNKDSTAVHHKNTAIRTPNISQIHQYVRTDSILRFYLSIISKISHPNERISSTLTHLVHPLVKHSPWLCVWQSLSFLNNKKAEIKGRMMNVLECATDVLWVLNEYVMVLERIGCDKRASIGVGDYEEIKRFMVPVPVSNELRDGNGVGHGLGNENCAGRTGDKQGSGNGEHSSGTKTNLGPDGEMIADHGRVRNTRECKRRSEGTNIGDGQAEMNLDKQASTRGGQVIRGGITLATITSYDERIVVFKSLQSPKKIAFVDENGRRRSFLVKANDDLRKDQRVIELFDLLIKCDLKIRKYVVVPFSSKLGIIEWIDGLISLKNICLANENKEIVSHIFKKYKKKLGKDFPVFNRKTKSVLSTWYNDTYKDPIKWHIARHNYTKTLAIMCAFGYFIGLGDRHCENILIDTKTGDVVHVDLNLLFDRAKKLSVPERVPFRLTKNVRECLGVLRETGKFRYYVQSTVRTIVRFRDVIEANLLAFVYDPIAEIKRPGDMISTLFRKMDGEDIVDRLIAEAVDDGNLGEMYVGWMPFI